MRAALFACFIRFVMSDFFAAGLDGSRFFGYNKVTPKKKMEVVIMIDQTNEPLDELEPDRVTLTDARNGNQVYCVVTDGAGNSVRTNTVTMTVG